MKKKENILTESRVRLAEFDSERNFERGASKMKFMLWYVVKRIFFLSAIPYPSKLKSYLLRVFGARIGRGLILKPRVNIHMPWRLEIGNNVWIGEEVFILNFERAVIKNNVCISQRALLCGGNHDYRTPEMYYRNDIIFLEDGVWIGAAAFIAPGVHIGVDSIVTAGSVLTTSVEGNLILQGNPAIPVGYRWK